VLRKNYKKVWKQSHFSSTSCLSLENIRRSPGEADLLILDAQIDTERERPTESVERETQSLGTAAPTEIVLREAGGDVFL
jgi:hypothetical protein